jgi:DNA-binding MarR family transcriptional regulator
LLARAFHQPALLYFESAAECFSIRESARRLNVASSAVSRQISQLEDALGMALFDRKGRRLKLTTAGKVLFRHVRRLVAPFEAAISELDMLRGLKTGSVPIATVESVGLSFLPRLLAEFGRRHPTLSRRRRGLSACFVHPVALGKRDLSIREAIEPILQGSVSIRSPLLEVGSVPLLVELAQIGHYVSITTPIGAHNEIRDGRRVFRPLEERRLPVNRFGLMVRSGGSLHFAPAVSYDHAKEHFRTIPLPGAIE